MFSKEEIKNLNDLVEGKPDETCFQTFEEMQAIREGLERAVNPELERLRKAKIKSLEAAANIVVD